MSQSRGHAPSPAASLPLGTRARHELPVVVPYRLDLTASACGGSRRTSSMSSRLTGYVRALGSAYGPVIGRVTQVRPDALAVTTDGDMSEHTRALTLVRRVLGVDRALTHFDREAARIAWLSPLALRMRGVKPPRYRTLWEAFVNAIGFQQLDEAARHARTIICCSRAWRRVASRAGVALVTCGYPGPENASDSE